MTPVFTARRRAEEFNSLVERASTGVDDTRYADVLELVSAMRDLPQPEARPEFVADLRAQLMTAADTLLVPGDDARLALPTRKRPTRDRRIAAVVGGFAIVGATTSMAMAAQSALPGDMLYPLKRAIENAQAGISVDDGQKGATLLETASGRLDEVTALSREGDVRDGGAIADTLNSFTEQATEASDLLLTDYDSTGSEESISELRDFTAASMQTLADLEALVPVDARDELLHAARVLTQIDAEAQQACPGCPGAGIGEIPKILTSSAGYVTPAKVEVAPATTQTGSTGSSTNGKPSGGKNTPGTDGGTLPPGSVLSPGGSGNTGGGQGGGGQSDDPISSLTEGLTGGGSQPTSNPSTGLPGLPEVGDDLDDALDELGDTLGGKDDNAKK